MKPRFAYTTLIFLLLSQKIFSHDTGTFHENTIIYNSTEVSLNCDSTSNCQIEVYQLKLRDAVNQNKETFGSLFIKREYESEKIQITLYSFEEDIYPTKSIKIETIFYKGELSFLEGKDKILGKTFRYTDWNFPGNKGVENNKDLTSGILSFNFEESDIYETLKNNPKNLGISVLKLRRFGDTYTQYTLEEIMSGEFQLIHDFTIVEGSLVEVRGKMTLMLVMNILFGIFGGFFLLVSIMITCVSHDKPASKYNIFYSIPLFFQTIVLGFYIFRYNKIVLLWVMGISRCIISLIEIPNMIFKKQINTKLKENRVTTFVLILTNVLLAIPMLFSLKINGIRFMPYYLMTAFIGILGDDQAFHKKGTGVHFFALYLSAPFLVSTLMTCIVEFYTSPIVAQRINPIELFKFLAFSACVLLISPLIVWVRQLYGFRDVLFSKTKNDEDPPITIEVGTMQQISLNIDPLPPLPSFPDSSPDLPALPVLENQNQDIELTVLNAAFFPMPPLSEPGIDIGDEPSLGFGISEQSGNDIILGAPKDDFKSKDDKKNIETKLEKEAKAEKETEGFSAKKKKKTLKIGKELKHKKLKLPPIEKTSKIKKDKKIKKNGELKEKDEEINS